MADNINVGILEALIKTGYDPKGIATFIDHLIQAKSKSISASSEVDKLKSAFTKLSASLDPVVAKEVKRQKATDLANKSLKEGIINNEKYNKTLKQIDASLDQLDRNKALRNLANLGSNLSSVGADLTKFITLPLIAIGAGSTKLAIDFESSFAGVRKTVDATEQEFAQLSRGLRDLAAGPDPIPIDVNKLNQIAESAGQLGIAKDDILDFTRTVANLGATTNLSLEEASEGIGKFQNIFGTNEAGKNVDRLGSTIVDLGNKFAATESQILEMGRRIAGAGHQINLTQGQVLAFAAALSSVGIEAEMGGSAISRTMFEISSAVDKGGKDLNNFAKVAIRSGLVASTEEFVRLFKQDAAQAINAFIIGLGKLKESGGNVTEVFEALGLTEIRQRTALVNLAGAGDLLTKSLEVQALAWSENNALAEEARKRYQTTASQITISINRIKDKAIDLGTSLLPVVKAALDIATPFIELLGNIAKQFSGMPPISQNVIISLVGLAAGMGPVLFISGQLIQSWVGLVAIAPKLSASILTLAGSLGPLAIALAAVTLAATYFINKWREASEEATRIAVQLGNLEGAALSFYRQIQSSGGKITKSSLVTAREDAERMAIALINAQNEVKKLKDLQQLGSASFNQDDLIEAERNVTTLSSAYEKQKAGLRGVKEVIDDTAPAVVDLTGNLNLQTNAAGKLTDQLADLERQYLNQVRLRKLASVGVEQTNKEKDQQKAIETVLRIQNQLKTEGLSLTQQQIDRIKALVIGIEEEKRLEDAIIRAKEKIGTLSIDYLSTVERTNEALKRANSYSFSMWEDSTKKALDNINKMIPRLDLLGKGMKNVFNPNISLDLLQSIASLVDEVATDEERRALALARSIELMKTAVSLGVLSADQAATVNSRVGQANANPLFTSAEQELYDFSADVLSTFRTINDDVNEYIAKIEHAVDAGFLSVLQGEEAIAAVREQRMMDQLQGWHSLFSTLSSMFGGFGATAINVIGQMISTWQTFQSAGSMIGGQMGGMISAAGPFFAIVGAAISLQQRDHARDLAGRFTSGASIGFQTGTEAEGFGRRGRALADALESALKPIMDMMGRALDSLPEITIRAREDSTGFEATVGSVVLGMFATMEDAIDAAAVEAMNQILSSLPESIRTAITNSGMVTTDDIKEAIEFALDYDNLGLSQIAIDLKDKFRQFALDVQQADKYGLDRLKFIDKLTTDINKIAYQLMGVDTSTSDALKNLIDINNVLKEQTDQLRQQKEQRIRDLQQGFEEFIRDRPRVSPERIAEERRRVEEEIDRITDEIAKLPAALTDVQISSTIFDQLYKYLEGNRKYAEDAVKYAKIKVEIEFALIRARLEELGKWEQFAGMFTDAYNAAMNAAGRVSTGRGGGNDARQSARDFVRDRSLQLQLNDMEEFARRRAEIEREYQDQLDALGGKDKKLRAEIIALREQELAQLDQERRQKTTESFQSFLGIGNSQFDQIHKTAEALIDEINDSPFGDPRKARMIARVMDEVNVQVEKLSRQMAVGLFSSMLSDMQAFGATDEQMRDARMAMAVLEHTIKMENYRTEIELLKAQGKLAPEVIAKLEGMFNFLSGIDPTRFILGTGGNNGGGNTNYDWVRNRTTFIGYTDDVSNGLNNVSNSLSRAQELLNRYRNEALSPYQRDLNEFMEEWQVIFAAFGNGPAIMAEYSSALERLNDQYDDDLEDFYDRIRGGDFGGVDIQTQYERSLANWGRLSTAIQGGDLSQSRAYVEQGERLLELIARIGGSSAGGGYTQLREQIEAELAQVLGIINSSGNGSNSSSSLSNSAASLMSNLPSSNLQSDPSQQIVGALNSSSSNEVRAIDRLSQRFNDLVLELRQHRPTRGGYGINWGDNPNQTPGTIGQVR